MKNLCDTCEHIHETGQEVYHKEIKWCIKLNCSKAGTFVRQCQFYKKRK